MSGLKRGKNQAEREEGGIGKKKGEAERGEKEGNGGAREPRKPDAENERKRDEGQKGRTASREERDERRKRERGDEIRRMAVHGAFARRGAERRRIRRLGRNAKREARRGKRGEGPCEALDDGDGIRNGAGAQREREERNDCDGGKTPPPGFAGSPLREGAGAARRGVARLAPPLGELASETRLRGFLAPPLGELASEASLRGFLAPPLGELASEARLRGSDEEQPAEETGGGHARRDGGRYRIDDCSGSGRGPRSYREQRESRDETDDVAARARRGGRAFAAPRAGRKLARRPPAGGARNAKKQRLRSGSHAAESTRSRTARQAGQDFGTIL